jgi:hypothetical protein
MTLRNSDPMSSASASMINHGEIQMMPRLSFYLFRHDQSSILVEHHNRPDRNRADSLHIVFLMYLNTSILISGIQYALDPYDHRLRSPLPFSVLK